jgi:hypothetical protein
MYIYYIYIQNVNTINLNQQESLSKISRNRFNSTGDLKQIADQLKNNSYNNLHNLINSNKFVQNQNLSSQKSNQMPGLGVFSHHRKSDSQNYSTVYRGSQMFYDSNAGYSPNNFIRMPHSLNDSGNFNLEDNHSQMFYNNMFPSIRPQPKRTNSSSQIEVKKMSCKNRNSLFMSVIDKEEKGEDFADLREVMSTINVPLWEYAKTQRGSRNLQKLLNKIEPGGLDEILEKLKNNFPELMVDTYGNYFCQKLIQSCSSEQRMFILRHVGNIFIFNYLDYE